MLQGSDAFPGIAANDGCGEISWCWQHRTQLCKGSKAGAASSMAIHAERKAGPAPRTLPSVAFDSALPLLQPSCSLSVTDTEIC
jgi:hypothetical protein